MLRNFHRVIGASSSSSRRGVTVRRTRRRHGDEGRLSVTILGVRNQQQQQKRLFLSGRCDRLLPYKQRLPRIIPRRGRGHPHHRRFSIIQSEKEAVNKKDAAAATIIKKPEELSELLLENPEALKVYLDKLSMQQRSEIQHLLRQQQQQSSSAAVSSVEEPSRDALRLVAINTAIPFVGFGIMDNSILILAGDAIDTSLGVVLGISTMCAAAIGNIVSDVAGVMMGTAIEDFTQKYLAVPSPYLSNAQRKLRSVRWANQAGCAVGIVIGCIIGMFPLFFIDSNKIQSRKREAGMDAIFQEVVTEAGKLLGAERAFLFVLCDKPKDESPSSVVPTADGKFLFAKYNNGKESHNEPFLPLGRGIVSRAALTREAWNIFDVRTEPDFIPNYRGEKASSSDKKKQQQQQQSPVQNMLCVPVLDGNDQTIAVLQAVNKVGKGLGDDDDGNSVKGNTTEATTTKNRGFTEIDEQILKALASHITVSLQRMMYETDGAVEEEKMRLRDMIRILKDSGLAQVQVPHDEQQRRRQTRRPLFPES